MTDQDEELFDRQAAEWTAGTLRKALEDGPGDYPVRVIISDEPGSGLASPGQVAISAALWSDSGDGSGTQDHFEISCEFPSGHYDRRSR